MMSLTTVLFFGLLGLDFIVYYGRQRTFGIPELFASARLGTFRRSLFLAVLLLATVPVLAQTATHETLPPGDSTVPVDKNPKIMPRFASNEPISLVVVLDASANNRPATFRAAQAAVTASVNATASQDELGLVISGNQARVAAQLGSRPVEIEHGIDTIQPTGFSALWDAMFLATQELQNVHHRRRVIMVVSDGQDEISRHTPSELASLLQKAGVEVYAIGPVDLYATRLRERLQALRFAGVVSTTGGQIFPAFSYADFQCAAAQASHEIHAQQISHLSPPHFATDN